MQNVNEKEFVWEQIYDDHGKRTHVVTSDRRREVYRLYKVHGDKLELIGKARTPVELKRKFKY